MFSWQDTKDRLAIVQMNAELRHAELELLSAQCATDRVRLRFSSEDVAAFAQQDILNRAVRAASALNSYYSEVDSQRSKVRPVGETFTEAEIENAVSQIIGY